MSAAMRARHADPEYRKVNAARAKGMIETRYAASLRALGIPDCAVDEYRRARKAHFSKKEAAAIACSHAATLAAREARA